jgi:Mg2+/citrate symporter
MSSGLQVQRTELAWLRTTLSGWAVALLTAKIAFPYGTLALAGPIIVSAVNYGRWRQLRDEYPPPRLSRTGAGLLTVACVILAVGCLMV